jgi:hypothetical protein
LKFAALDSDFALYALTPKHGGKAVVTVHRFRVRDFLTDKWMYSVCKRTAKSVEAFGGEIVEGTAEEVSEEELDGEGRYVMRAESPYA